MSAGDATKAPNLVRVRLARNGRSLDCDCPALGLRPGDQVVVDDRRGGGLATVMVSPGGRAGGGECGRLIRKAEPRDLARAAHEQKRQQEALTFGRERARALRLPIKLFRAEIAQGSDRATFFFSCDQRVDFRALVRDLAAYLHVRVEMRQVGVRDEARLTGGLGSCGRELCCSSHLRHFAPVSIKMAKHQHLVLNPPRSRASAAGSSAAWATRTSSTSSSRKACPRSAKGWKRPKAQVASRISMCSPARSGFRSRSVRP